MSKYLRHLETQFRQISTLRKLDQKNHYDTLGVTAKATQADIKSAYYKLSMVHHPDKSTASGDGTKFRDITEAYEVLGNVKTRKLYDKGLYIQTPSSTYEEDIPLNKFYKSRDTKSRPPAQYGRTTVYDFDEWSKSHYGATFQRGLRFREKEKNRRRAEEQTEQVVRSEKVLLLLGGLLLLFGYAAYDRDYDDPRRPPTL